MTTLPRLTPLTPFVDGSFKLTPQAAQYVETLTEALESALNGLEEQQAQLEDQQKQIATQLATIQRITQSISYTEGLTIQANAGSANASIAISAHERIYLDIPAVSVNSGQITGVPFGTDCLIYYDDPNRAGGAASYAYTTDPNQAATSDANPGRVFVGEVIAPASASAAPTTGTTPTPPTHGTPGKAQE